MKKSILLATGALVAAGFATDAKAVDVDVYGQVNKTLTFADNGTQEEMKVSDNDNSSTRIGVKGEQMLDNGLTASVLLEMEIQGDATNGDLVADASDDTNGDTNQNTLTERHARVGLAGDFGTVLMGHTGAATDGITAIDHAGVADLMGSELTLMVGETSLTATVFDDVNDNQVVDAGERKKNTVALDVDHNAFDGARADAVAYMTPVFNGFQGSVSLTDGDSAQMAVRYNGEIEGVMVSAGLGFENDSENDREVLAGSASAKHESGLGATFAFGKEENDENAVEANSMYFKVGYTMDALELAVDYTQYDNDVAGANTVTSGAGDTSAILAEGNVETSAFGIGAQYNLGNGVSVAAAYKRVETDVQAFTSTAGGAAEAGITSVDDLDVFAANLRVKF